MEYQKAINRGLSLSRELLDSIGITTTTENGQTCMSMEGTSDNEALNTLMVVVAELHLAQLKMSLTTCDKNEDLLMLAKVQKHLEGMFTDNVNRMRELIADDDVTIGRFRVPENG